MNYEIVFWLLISIPAISGLVCVLAPSPKLALGIMCVGVFSWALLGLFAIKVVLLQGKTLFAAADWLFMDALSAYHLICHDYRFLFKFHICLHIFSAGTSA